MGEQALITGATSGIGLAFAHHLAAQGLDLILVSRTESNLAALSEELRKEADIDVRIIPADLTDPASIDNVFSTLEEWDISPSVLVNSAGWGAHAPFCDTPWEDLESMIALNVTASTWIAHELGRRMVKAGRGTIINIASTAAFQPGPLMAVYYATKAYVVSLSEALAHELSGSGVTVTAVCPGPERTGFQDAAGINDMRALRVLPSVGAQKVAEVGWKTARKGRRVVVVGKTNRVLATVAKFGPNWMGTRVAAWMNAE